MIREQGGESDIDSRDAGKGDMRIVIRAFELVFLYVAVSHVLRVNDLPLWI